jgi:ribosomal protein RSM22 (predicted rRNA methylase)
MSQLGQALMRDAAFPADTEGLWVIGDIMNNIATADLVVASYAFNEMAERQRGEGLLKLWDAAGMMLIIVEPGTTLGYGVISAARQLLLARGGHIIAPCPHEGDCPLEPGDWCHFAQRVPRSRLQRELKGGSAPYEDEKYSYLAVAREPLARKHSRILRHPYTEKGQVSLELCTEGGLLKKTIRKKDGILYKHARKAKWGDSLE